MINFLAIYEKKLWEVKAIDWDHKGDIITCHLHDGQQTVKVYPEKDYGDVVTLLRVSNKTDINGKNLYQNALVNITYTNGVRVQGEVIYDTEEEAFKLKTPNSTDILRNHKLEITGTNLEEQPL